MNNQNQMVMVYETMLSVPGMNEQVKFNQSIARNQVLLLSLLIETGLQSEEAAIQSLLSAMPAGTAAALKELADEYLLKAGLTELSSKLKNYHGQGK